MWFRTIRRTNVLFANCGLGPEIDISVSKLLPIFEGFSFGFKKFGLRKKSWFRKIWSRKKSLDFGKFGIRKKVDFGFEEFGLGGKKVLVSENLVSEKK